MAILLMLPANYMEHIRVVPAWLKHAPDVGLTIVDLVAPFFIFAIALTGGDALRRRIQREGAQKAVEHLVKRSMALVGIGALFTVGETSYGFNPNGIPWGTLQAIGVAVLLSAPFLLLPTWPRLLAALVLLGGYQFMLDRAWLETVLASSHAGIQGSLSWTALLVLGTVHADLFRSEGRRAYWLLLGVMLAAGLALSGVFPLSKHRMSVSFDLLASSLSALAFTLTDAWVRARGAPLGFLVTWGRNPLVMYVSHLFLLSVFLVPAAPWWHVEAGGLQALVQGVAFVLVLDQWARFLERRRWFISL
ncbi:MAG: DUF5009 domain-containing protein [Deltaproteobacteria bacterium]|nr:DUF5009 domain-containing protein [Deltaproteobacteria bacterium]